MKLKSIIMFLTWSLFFHFFNGHIHNVVRRWKWQRWFDIVQHCKFQRWRTQRCFNVDLTLYDVATSYQPKNNVETTLKYLLGSHLSWIAASLLVACVCSIYLVDELILMFDTPLSRSGASGGSFDVFQQKVSMD